METEEEREVGWPTGRGDHALRLAKLIAVEQAAREATNDLEEWLRIFRDSARNALTDLSLSELLRAGLNAIASALEADAVSILIANDEGTELIGHAAIGLTREVELDVQIPIGAGPSGRVLGSGEALIIDDLETAELIAPPLLASGLRSYAGVPLQTADRVLGVLHVNSRQPFHFVASDLAVLRILAQPIATTIERVRLFEAERSARAEAEEAQEASERSAKRLDALFRITAALSAAVTVEDVCKVMLDHDACALYLPEAERAIWVRRADKLVLLAGGGQSAEFPEIPLDDSLPAADNLRDGTALFVESRLELTTRWPVLKKVRTAAFAGLPLRSGGESFGLLALGFASDHQFAPDEREFLAALATQAAVALTRAEARVALEEARARSEERRQQLAFIATASDRLAASLDLDVTIRHVGALSVPRLADRCALYLLEGNTISKQVLAPVLNRDEQELFEHSQLSIDAPNGIGAVLRTGRSHYVELVDDSLLESASYSADELDLLRRVGFGGVFITPLFVRGRVLGALAFINRAGRPMLEDEKVLAEELGARAAVAVDNALLYVRESQIASRLSKSLLPGRLPEVPGLEFAARYLPGSAGLDVGGDFYDCLEVGPDKWMLVVGDVQGKGVEAAALTGLARHTIRSISLIDPRPAAVLRHLNDVLLRHAAELEGQGNERWDTTQCCTATLVLLDHHSGIWTATVASAGHPLPLLRSPSGEVTALGAHGLLLGASSQLRVSAVTTELETDSVLVCYTDGVSERRRSGAMFGSEGVISLMEKTDGSPAEFADALLSEALGSDQPIDDVVVLVTRVGTNR